MSYAIERTFDSVIELSENITFWYTLIKSSGEILEKNTFVSQVNDWIIGEENFKKHMPVSKSFQMEINPKDPMEG